MSEKGKKFNPPPGWPKPPAGWSPPAGWTPDPKWPAMPDGWELWIVDSEAASVSEVKPSEDQDRSPETDETEQLKAEVSRLQQLLLHPSPEDELVTLSDEAVLQSIGIYQYNHPLENAAGFRSKLDEIAGEIATLVKNSQAIVASTNFSFENSLAKGRRLTADLGKLMLRAYNSEADNCIRSLRAGNIQTATKRLEASRKAIAKLGAIMEMRISDEYHSLRLQEVELTSDWLMKKREEKEQERENRARLREEKRIEKEFANERERLLKEKSHLENALETLRRKGEQNLVLEENLSALNDAIAQNDYRLANIRSGYVYVISNRGAFGQDVVKIGLTRRLEPNDRITELGGASVPFRFDVHALFFSEDAVTLENELHHHFRDRAVNVVNSRKEFFFAKPSEVREVLVEKVGSLLEFSENAEAMEYLQSSKYWPEGARS